MHMNEHDDCIFRSLDIGVSWDVSSEQFQHYLENLAAYATPIYPRLYTVLWRSKDISEKRLSVCIYSRDYVGAFWGLGNSKVKCEISSTPWLLLMSQVISEVGNDLLVLEIHAYRDSLAFLHLIHFIL